MNFNCERPLLISALAYFIGVKILVINGVGLDDWDHNFEVTGISFMDCIIFQQLVGDAHKKSAKQQKEDQGLFMRLICQQKQPTKRYSYNKLLCWH